MPPRHRPAMRPAARSPRSARRPDPSGGYRVTTAAPEVAQCAAVTSECLDANAVQDFMAGALDTATRSAAIAHLDRCADCRDLISLLARAATRDAAIDTLRDAEPRNIALLETAITGGDSARPDPLAETAAVTSGGATHAQRIKTPSQTGRVLGRY